jgi:hypothetical protein
MMRVRAGNFRIGQRLKRPSGSDPVQLSGSSEPQRSTELHSGSAVIAITIVYGGLVVVFLVVGMWFLALPLLTATVICWLRWAANPHSVTQTPREQDASR